MNLNDELLDNLSKSLPATVYVKLTKEISFEIHPGSIITMMLGSIGYILNEFEISALPNTAIIKKCLIEEMMYLYKYKTGCVYVLINGYPCVLLHSEFEILDYIPHRCCGEISCGGFYAGS